MQAHTLLSGEMPGGEVVKPSSGGTRRETCVCVCVFSVCQTLYRMSSLLTESRRGETSPSGRTRGVVVSDVRWTFDSRAVFSLRAD